MATKERPLEITNLDQLMKVLESEQERPEENSFIDFQEPEILDDPIYRQMQKPCKKYGYAVSNKK